jgi:Protein of unknown function (DUF2975)
MDCIKIQKGDSLIYKSAHLIYSFSNAYNLKDKKLLIKFKYLLIINKYLLSLHYCLTNKSNMIIKIDFFKVLHVVAWVIFIGLCFEAGGLLFNTIFKLFLSPADATKLWNKIDLNALYDYNQSRYVTLTSLMVIVAVMKALLAYLIVKIFHDKKLDLAKPFNEIVGRFIINMSYLALGIGLFSSWGAKVRQSVTSQNIAIPDLQDLGLGGADVWFFMWVMLLVIAQIFKKGIEIQEENELTV